MKRRTTVAIRVPCDPNIKRKILSGDRDIIILDGEYDHQVGDNVVLYCYPETWNVIATIASVRHDIFQNVTPEECADHDCFPASRPPCDDLAREYPTLAHDTKITIVRWDNVRGEAKNDWIRNQYDYSVS